MFWWAPRLQIQVDILSLTPKSHLPGHCPGSVPYLHPLIGLLGQSLAWAHIGLFPPFLVTQSQNPAGRPVPGQLTPCYSLSVSLGQVPAVSVVTEVIPPPCPLVPSPGKALPSVLMIVYIHLSWPLPPTCSVQLNFKKTISNSSQKKVKEKRR